MMLIDGQGRALYAHTRLWSIDDDYARVDLTLGIVHTDNCPEDDPYMTVTSTPEDFARLAFSLATLEPGATMTIGDGSMRCVDVTNVNGARYIAYARDADDAIGEVALDRVQVERLIEDWLRVTGR